jgi:protein required for attachment to host cells
MAKRDEVTWFVVADGGKARMLTRAKNGAMTTVSHFDSSGHGDTGEDDAATISQIKAPKSDPGAQIKALFARQVAAHLNAAVETQQVDSIVLVAPGRVLSEIKEALDKRAAGLVRDSISKDLTNIPDHELGSHFPGIIDTAA